MTDDPRSTPRGALDAEAMLEEHFPAIRRLIRRKLGGRLDGSAESLDLAQSVMRRALEGRDAFEFRGDRQLRNWVLTLAERRVVDWIRRECAEKRGRHLRSDRDADAVAAACEAPSREAAARDELERLRAAIDALPEELRLPLVLHRLEGYSYEDVARRLGLTIKQVRRRVEQARLELGRRLGEPPHPS